MDKKSLAVYIAAGVALVLAVIVAVIVHFTGGFEPKTEQESTESISVDSTDEDSQPDSTQTASQPTESVDENDSESAKEDESATQNESERESENASEVESENESTLEDESESSLEPLETTPEESVSEEVSEIESMSGDETEETTDHTYFPEIPVTVSFPTWAEDIAPVITYPEPVGLGDKNVIMDEHYKDHSFVSEYRYGTMALVHVGRFPGSEIGSQSAQEVIETYIDLEFNDNAMWLDTDLSNRVGGVAWKYTCWTNTKIGGVYYDYVTLIQYGSWDVFYMVSYPEAAAPLADAYARTSADSLVITPEQILPETEEGAE